MEKISETPCISERIDISILILTHNRPKLFKRCIESVFKAYEKYPNYKIEILINNDTCDITEIFHKDIKIKYFYTKSNNLSKTYEYLFRKAKGNHIYFLEDDDYIVPYFFNKLNLQKALHYMNFIEDNKSWNMDTINNFKIETTNDRFQFSQIMFRKKLLDIFEFPNTNELHNDWKIFQTIFKKISAMDIKLVKDFMYVQTTDGNDNISFPELNKDERWISKNVQNN